LSQPVPKPEPVAKVAKAKPEAKPKAAAPKVETSFIPLEEAIPSEIIKKTIILPKPPKPEKIEIEKKIKEFEKVGSKYGYVMYSAKTFIGSVAYIALLLEYGSKCILLDEDLNNMTINVTRQVSIDELYKKAKQYSNDIKGCIQRGEKIISIPLSIRFGDKKSGHANMLIYRPENKTIERFEPHGQAYQLVMSKYDERIYTILKTMFEKKMKPFLKEYTPTYVPANQTCPNIKGLQAIENEIEKKESGFCTLWGLFILELIFLNPTKTTREITEEALKIANSNPQYLTNVIRCYVIKMEKLLDSYIKKINANDGFTFKAPKNIYGYKTKIQEKLLDLLAGI
jgi:hypothetical protein